MIRLRVVSIIFAAGLLMATIAPANAQAPQAAASGGSSALGTFVVPCVILGAAGTVMMAAAKNYRGLGSLTAPQAAWNIPTCGGTGFLYMMGYDLTPAPGDFFYSHTRARQ